MKIDQLDVTCFIVWWMDHTEEPGHRYAYSESYVYWTMHHLDS